MSDIGSQIPWACANFEADSATVIQLQTLGSQHFWAFVNFEAQSATVILFQTLGAQKLWAFVNLEALSPTVIWFQTVHQSFEHSSISKHKVRQFIQFQTLGAQKPWAFVNFEGVSLLASARKQNILKTPLGVFVFPLRPWPRNDKYCAAGVWNCRNVTFCVSNLTNA